MEELLEPKHSGDCFIFAQPTFMISVSVKLYPAMYSMTLVTPSFSGHRGTEH